MIAGYLQNAGEQMLIPNLLESKWISSI